MNNIQGKVTSVNKQLCYVMVENRFKIHFGLLRRNNFEQKLPKIGTIVDLKNVCYNENSVFVLNNDCELIGNYEIPTSFSYFVKYLKDKNIDEKNLIILDKYLNILENDFDQIINNEVAFFKILDTFFFEFEQQRNDDITNDVLLSVNKFKNVKILTKDYCSFPYWSYGVHKYDDDDDLKLFGFLYISFDYGILMIKDKNHKIPLLIKNNKNNNCKMESIINCYVLLKNFHIFTEIFNNESVPNIEYIVINYENILPIFQLNSFTLSDGFPIDDNKYSLTNNFTFTILRKSNTVIGTNSNMPECWLDVIVYDGNNGSHNCFLVLPRNYLTIAFYLKERFNYRLFFKDHLKESKEVQLSRIKTQKIYRLPENMNEVHFQDLKREYLIERILNVKECKNEIRFNKEMLNFEGILLKKHFETPMYMYRLNKCNLYGFGTPGSQNHNLVFKMQDGDNENNIIYLDCYLGRWNLKLMPLGLLPNMRLIARNVQPQSQKYLIPNAFTTFEILSYEPQVHFQTVNLYDLMDLNWGARSFLGYGSKLEKDILIWGRVFQTLIFRIDINISCTICDLNVCCRCQNSTKLTRFYMKLNVKDDVGKSDVIVKNINLLRIFLDFTEEQFDLWLKGLYELIDEFHYQSSINNIKNKNDDDEGYGYCDVDDNNDDDDDDNDNDGRRVEMSRMISGNSLTDLFKNNLTEYLENFNKFNTEDFDLKCRLMDTKKLPMPPLWFLLDAKNSWK